MNTTQSLHLHIYGEVQGVGYRYSALAEAKVLGLQGWVRNHDDDGSVEAVIHGPTEAVEAFLRWAHKGPPHAHVTHIQSRPTLPPDQHGFEVLASVP